jgi:hypothetical protein
MLVADRGGRIIGFRALMRWRFVGPEGDLRAVSPVDTATHPDFQRQGIFSRLTQAALGVLREEADLVYNTPNESSRPGYLKMGWQDVGRVPVAVRLCRPLRCATSLLPLRLAIHRPGLPPPIDAEAAASVFGRDGGQIAELLPEAEPPADRIRTKRSLDYLRWRYATVPHLDYRAITERRDGRVRGLAVFRVVPRGRLWGTSVVELIVPPGDLDTARSLLKQVRRSAPVDYLKGIFPEGMFAALAAGRYGFFGGHKGITLVVNPLHGNIRPDPARMGSWALSLGDVEVF